jgi:hypothetical protein
MTLSEFKRSLSKNKVDINPHLSSIIRRHEAGESVPFVTFGKEIFKQVEQNEGINPDFIRPASPVRQDAAALN